MNFTRQSYSTWSLPSPLSDNTLLDSDLPSSLHAYLIRRGFNTTTKIAELLSPKSL